MKKPLRGLYAITDSSLIAPGRLLDVVSRAITGGAAVIQYRDKGLDGPRRERDARDLLALCRSHGVPLIINDDVALAQSVGADGVHLGCDDTPLTEARRILGAATVIGVSCYNNFELAVTAQAEGADYIAFGRFFASQTKPSAVQASIDLIRRAKATLAIPVVAIGGITPDNGAVLVEAGVDMLAVVGGVFGRPDPAHAARRYTQLFEQEGNT
ncbi:MAG: thiamine phosphate synthase [Gammaproteobacteria bacterium]|nr:thiamine phosphate synthase [Gammaproteobacteria bacterium]